MSNWDHIRIEGDGESAHGRVTRVWRNGVLVPGVRHATLEMDADDVTTLTLTQYVILEKDEDVVERATQALEEREAAWDPDNALQQQLDAIDRGFPGAVKSEAAFQTEHRREPESLIPNNLRPMLESMGYMPASLILPEIDEPEVPSGGPAD